MKVICTAMELVRSENEKYTLCRYRMEVVGERGEFYENQIKIESGVIVVYSEPKRFQVGETYELKAEIG